MTDKSEEENSTALVQSDESSQPQNDAVVNTESNQQQQQQQQQQPSRMESFFAVTKSLIIRALIIYFVSSFLRRPATDAPTNITPDSANPTAAAGQKTPAWNLFENGTIFDLHVYISDDLGSVNFTDSNSLIWFQDGLTYGDWYGGRDGDGTVTHRTTIRASEKLQNNGSIFIHVYATKTGFSPNPNDPNNYAGHQMGHISRILNKFKKIRYLKTHNLLTGQTEKSAHEVEKAKIMSSEIVSHWHPNLTINMVTDQTNWVRGSVPPPLDEFVSFNENGQIYYPILYLNDYWNLMRDYQPVNTTVKELELTLTYQPLTLFKWQLYAAQAAKNKWTSGMFGETLAGATDESDEDQDSIKETLLDTNPYLLGLTIAISILHSVFELLAFKNDIQFWNNRKSLEGLSVRSVFFGVFQSLIVLLYVLDNDTNFMIRVSCFIGLGIEVWKIQKVVDFKFERENRIFGIIPKLTFSDKGSYVDSSTKVYDNLAFKYLGWMCFPLLLGYGVYSVIYNEHKGWYSFVLNMLYGFLLTFGFIMMTPQLFINYKLKSVAHMPWRMMTYKFLNTFIDDVFAFVIKMPTMYRLGCFRDDIVFFIFLYQRWVYKVDKSRVNEFGFSGEMEEKNKTNTGETLAIEGTPTVAETSSTATATTTPQPKEKSKKDKKRD